MQDMAIVTMEDKLGTRMRSMNGAISMTLSDLAKCSMTRGIVRPLRDS